MVVLRDLDCVRVPAGATVWKAAKLRDLIRRDFTLDRFQLEAIEHLDAGRSVLVAAPTGSGKTVVAEHAIDRALSERKRAFYTAPIKALSNQKYRDLSERIGSSRVGLLTGDNAINADADIVVMTTEVLRNMLYEGRVLDDLAFVIMDEVHYLEDTFEDRSGKRSCSTCRPMRSWCVCRPPFRTPMSSPAGSNPFEGDRMCRRTEAAGRAHQSVRSGRPRGHRLHVISPPRRRGQQRRPSLRPDLRRGRRIAASGRKPVHDTGALDVLDHLEDHDLLPVIWFVFSRRVRRGRRAA